MTQIIVLSAHSGATIVLDCQQSTRVDEFQQLLSELTGIPPADQILTNEGTPLTPPNLLSDYGLFSTPGGEKTISKNVFLYSRALLRQDSPTSPPFETLPELPTPDKPPSEDRKPHPLDTASSPLLRALPEYYRQFQQHLREAEAAAEASASRVTLCCRLVNESEVQAMAVDAAMSSVEPHYAFICSAQASFQDKFSRKFAFHQDVLSSFDADVEFLCSIKLPEQLHYNHISKLSDLVDLEQLKTIANESRRSHQRFSSRVSELESVHSAMTKDVETLFMRAPCVDLDDLTQGLAAAEAGTDELTTIVQALTADMRRAEVAMAEASSASSTAPGSSQVASMSINLQDTVGMLEAMHEAHITTVLPAVEKQETAVEEFARRCVEAKNALSTDALHTLRTIASQQSKIREMKEALAPFPAALDRQDAQITRLLVVRRVPAAFKTALAECLRRAAFAEKYTSFAKTLEEKMGEFRNKEEAMRNTFKDHVEGHLPLELLKKMGLEGPPPACTVSVPAEEVKLLLPVTPEDLRGMQLPRYASSSIQNISETAGTSAAAPVAAAAPLPSRAASGSWSSSSLQLQNANLRAELAIQKEKAEKEAMASKERIEALETALAKLQTVKTGAAPLLAAAAPAVGQAKEKEEEQTTETQ